MIKDLRPALRAHLLADSSIATAVGGATPTPRIFPGVLPQGITSPSIVYNRIANLGDYHMEGASGLAQPRYQIDAYAAEADDANALADLVKFRLDGFRGEMIVGGSPPDLVVNVQGVFLYSERDEYEPASKLHRTSRDYTIWFEER